MVDEHRAQPRLAIFPQHFDLQQIAREDRFAGVGGIGDVLPGDDATQWELREQADVDHPRVVAFDENDVGVQPAQVVAVELLERVDVLYLLHAEHVDIHPLDARCE